MICYSVRVLSVAAIANNPESGLRGRSCFKMGIPRLFLHSKSAPSLGCPVIVLDIQRELDAVQVHSSVRVLEGSLAQLRDHQMSANTGIYLLCRSATLHCPFTAIAHWLKGCARPFAQSPPCSRGENCSVCTCRVVGDLMKSAGHRMGSMKELDTYIRDPRGISGHVQVLVNFCLKMIHTLLLSEFVTAHVNNPSEDVGLGTSTWLVL